MISCAIFVVSDMFRSLKKDWVLKALRAGKHVVLEKPAACSAADFEEMLTVAYAQNKFLMDGSMFPHHIRTKQLLNDLSTKSSESSQLPTSIGRIDRLEATFTFLAEEDWMNSNIRARKQNGDPQGCLGDIGWYCIYFALLVYGKLGYRVESAQAVDFELNKHEVPIEATCVVRFEGVS